MNIYQHSDVPHLTIHSSCNLDRSCALEYWSKIMWDLGKVDVRDGSKREFYDDLQALVNCHSWVWIMWIQVLRASDWIETCTRQRCLADQDGMLLFWLTNVLWNGDRLDVDVLSYEEADKAKLYPLSWRRTKLNLMAMLRLSRLLFVGNSPSKVNQHSDVLSLGCLGLVSIVCLCLLCRCVETFLGGISMPDLTYRSR